MIISGNAKSQSYHLAQTNHYYWPEDLAKLHAEFLKTQSGDVETARAWALGLRYERNLSEDLSALAGELVESNIFAGYRQRYSTDLGGKYHFLNGGGWNGSGEAGYRYTLENRESSQTFDNYLRFYAELARALAADVSAKLWAEYLPNLTHSDDYQFNSELSVSAALSSIFSLKTAYLMKYRGVPTGVLGEKTDSTFTAALVAKF